MAGPAMRPMLESPVWPFHDSEKVNMMRARSAGPLKTHRHVLAGRDFDSHNRTVILWWEADLVYGQVERHIVITLDATLRTAVILTLQQAIELADALRAAAGIR